MTRCSTNQTLCCSPAPSDSNDGAYVMMATNLDEAKWRGIGAVRKGAAVGLSALTVSDPALKQQ